MTIRQLFEARGKAITEARSILDAARGKDLTPEQRQSYDRAMAEAKRLADEMQRERDVLELEKDQRESEDRSTGRRSDPEPSEAERRARGGDRPNDGSGAYTMEYRGRRTTFAAGTPMARAAGDRYRRFYLERVLGCYVDDGRSGDSRFVMSEAEARALSFGINTEGGFLSPPQLAAKVLRKMDDILFMRARATVYPGAPLAGLGFPSLESDPGDAQWNSEVGETSEDSTMAFGLRELKPQVLDRMIKVSRMLLDAGTVIDLESLVADRLAYKLAVPQENAFLNGSGAGQPLGVFTASDMGIPTSRDVSTGNAATSIAVDGLKSARGALKAQYRRNAEWVFHRDAITQIEKLKDAEGRYLLELARTPDQRDTILGHAVNESEYAPNTFTSGLYVGLLGDLSNYVIAESGAFSLQRLDELYARSKQVGYQAVTYVDGMPASVGGEAFVRVKLG